MEGHYFTDVSLLFSMRWVAATCQDIASLIIRDLPSKRLHLLSYINDFGVIARSEQQAQQHFTLMHTTVEHLGLQEVLHKKACSLTRIMTWLGFEFNDSYNTSE